MKWNSRKLLFGVCVCAYTTENDAGTNKQTIETNNTAVNIHHGPLICKCNEIGWYFALCAHHHCVSPPNTIVHDQRKYLNVVMFVAERYAYMHAHFVWLVGKYLYTRCNFMRKIPNANTKCTVWWNFVFTWWLVMFLLPKYNTLAKSNNPNFTYSRFFLCTRANVDGFAIGRNLSHFLFRHVKYVCQVFIITISQTIKRFQKFGFFWVFQFSLKRFGCETNDQFQENNKVNITNHRAMRVNALEYRTFFINFWLFADVMKLKIWRKNGGIPQHLKIRANEICIEKSLNL